MKRLVICLLFCVLTLTGCQSKELPKNIESVGGVLVKEDDLLEPPAGEAQIGVDSSVDLSTEPLTAAMVQGWYDELIEDEFVETENQEGIRAVQAKLKDGGTIRISTYYDSYYSTTFAYDAAMSSEDIAGCMEENIKIYLARDLTREEKAEILKCVQSVGMGAEMSYLSTFTGFMNGYLYKEDNQILLQCSN